jgi:hypothetical protein
MRGQRLLAVMIIALGLGGCGNEPGVYDLPLHEAFTRLATNKLEDFSFKHQCGILIHLSPEPIEDESVRWGVFSSGEEVLNFTARLTAVGEKKTRVAVEISKDADGSEAYDGKDDYPRPALKQPLRPALEEAVASALEGRPFDESKLTDVPGDNRVCNIQRAGLEAGHRFTIHDEPGTWAR